MLGCQSIFLINLPGSAYVRINHIGRFKKKIKSWELAFTRVGLYASTYVLSTVSGQQYLPLDHIHPDLGHFRLLDLIQSPILFEETGLNLTDLWRHNPMKMVLGTEIRNSEISCICSYCYWSTIAEISAEQCQFWKSDWKPWNQTAGRSGRVVVVVVVVVPADDVTVLNLVRIFFVIRIFRISSVFVDSKIVAIVVVCFVTEWVT